MNEREGVPLVSGFAVELPAFTGPFRVLSDLILQQKVDVCDVAIGSITDAFLAHVKDVDAWSLDEATLFLAICAVLLELKVGRLMPRHEVLDEEDLLGISPDLAYARSIELLAIRRVALDLAARMEEEAMSFPRLAGPPPEFAHLYPDVMTGVDPAKLAAQGMTYADLAEAVIAPYLRDELGADAAPADEEAPQAPADEPVEDFAQAWDEEAAKRPIQG